MYYVFVETKIKRNPEPTVLRVSVGLGRESKTVLIREVDNKLEG